MVRSLRGDEEGDSKKWMSNVYRKIGVSYISMRSIHCTLEPCAQRVCTHLRAITVLARTKTVPNFCRHIAVSHSQISDVPKNVDASQWHRLWQWWNGKLPTLVNRYKSLCLRKIAWQRVERHLTHSISVFLNVDFKHRQFLGARCDLFMLPFCMRWHRFWLCTLI